MIIYPYRYQYQKQVPSSPLSPVKTPRTSNHNYLKLIPPTLITLGSVLIANVLWPLLTYQIFTAPSMQKETWLSPVPKEFLGSGSLRGDLTGLSQSTPPRVLGMDVDYTQVRAWFPSAAYPPDRSVSFTYSLDIPSLKIEDALVVVGSDSLDKNLVHYPGTAEPGAYGTPVIFGHSVLRQFYQPQKTNPRRYVSIFSKIMTLKPGDRIFIDHNGVIYTYEVYDKYEVAPEDISDLKQRLDIKELKLITCVPEGTYLRRGVVAARLINFTHETETNVVN